MIIIRLDGGLGNQMFQYALGYILSLKKNTLLKFDDSLLGEKNFHEFHTNRNFELDIFNNSYDFARQVEIDSLKNKEVTSLTAFKYKYIFRDYVPYFKKQIFYEKGLFVFDENVFKIPSNCYLLGYWQNEKYFVDYRNKILDIFKFPKLENEKNTSVLNQIKSTNSVSIHIRRGDYVHNAAANKMHGNIVSENYYKNSIQAITEKAENPTFFVFSDEVDWVKENISFPENTRFIDWNKGKESYIDMQLMSNCNHNIIANSSFSWWAAWLNQNPNKTVIAPKKWMLGDGINDEDVCPNEWIRL